MRVVQLVLAAGAGGLAAAGAVVAECFEAERTETVATAMAMAAMAAMAVVTALAAEDVATPAMAMEVELPLEADKMTRVARASAVVATEDR